MADAIHGRTRLQAHARPNHTHNDRAGRSARPATGTNRRGPFGIALALWLVLAASGFGMQPGRDISPGAMKQIQALVYEKATRTPAQQKIDSQLLYALRFHRHEALASEVPSLRTGVEVDPVGFTVVDIRAGSTDALGEALTAMGGQILSRYTHDVRVRIPLVSLEEVAARADVRWIMPAARATVNKNNTSEGDTTHRAAAARTAFGFNGTGVRVGVLSDSSDNLATVQGTGDLPAGVTVLPGQSGSPGTGEGTAMMEIVFDLAPNAGIYFATGFNGLAGMGNNIRALRNAPYNCDIIVDDVTYFVETPFHQGDSGAVSTTGAADIIQAVNDVVAGGALYFSSAANDGNLDAGQSGTWEGDFANGGAAGAPLPAGTLHNFGGGQTWDVLTSGVNPGRNIDLWWADPLGGSNNDYDLYLLDSTGTAVLTSSTNVQSGTQDPVEAFAFPNPIPAGWANPRLVILQKTGAAGRFLHLGTNRGRLSIGTGGATRGHNAIGGMSVAATPAVGPFPNPFNATNLVETFSSDGFRRTFFTAANAAITPGNFSSTGGSLLSKPDMTAADGVSCATPGFNPFFGTSAAAPHAGAIAALLKSANPAFTAAQIINFMKSTAIDIQAAGVDRDSGSGIVMAYQAIAAALPCAITPPANITVANAPAQCGAVVTWPAPTTSGACGPLTVAPASGSFFPVGTTTVNITADSGATSSFTVTVQDTTPPTVVCPPTQHAQAPDMYGVVVNYPAATASDNCAGVTIAYSMPSGSKFPPGVTNVTVTATDASGNITTCTFAVDVVAPLPTLSTWGITILVLLLAGLGFFAVRTRIGR